MNTRPVLIVMCGLSFSGKSTIARNLADRLGATVISLDAISEERGLHGGQGIPLEEWRATNDFAHERTERLLRNGVDVVVDDTSSPRFLRDEWREIADAVAARFELLYVRADSQMIRERVRTNRHEPSRPDVVDTVLTEHTAQFEPPATDETHRTIASNNSNDDSEIAAIAALLIAAR